MATSVGELQEFVTSLLKEELSANDLSPESRLDDIGMDSLTYSEVLISVEKEYEIDLEELQERFVVGDETTISDLVDVIRIKLIS